MTFSERESEFQKLWAQYTYTQRVLFEVLDRRGNVKERRDIEYEIFFTSDGKRSRRKVSDAGRIESVIVTDRDLESVTNLQPFVLTRAQLRHYDVKYRGRERVDELDTYVFEIRPRRIDRGRLYFKGRVWVDEQDLMIVQSRGKAVPEERNEKFPVFETVRQQVDGEHWFPVWSGSDEVLQFAVPVHIRQTVVYENFRRFEVDSKITFGEPTGEEKKEEKKKPIPPGR